MKMETRLPLRKPAKSGFALIATISLLILLTVVAVAFLSLSTVSVRSAQSDWALEEARANARLALMIAIGELQRDLGPDQRISASAAIFDENPEQPGVSGVRHPHWLGVWSTQFDETETGIPWVRDDSRGGLRDERVRGYDRKKEARNYLVSGGEGGARVAKNGKALVDPIRGKIENDQLLTLVGPGSVNREDDEVFVRRIETMRNQRLGDGSRVKRPGGSYGYWVSDLGARANVGSPDRHRNERPGFDGRGMQRLTHAQDYDLEALSGIEALSDDDLEKIISPLTLSLSASSEKDSVRELFHDITSYSRSLLTNVRDSGLQRDLTSFLNLSEAKESASIAPLKPDDLKYAGIADTDNVAGPPNPTVAGLMKNPAATWEQLKYTQISPTFGLMREWARRAQDTSFTNTMLDADLGETVNLVNGGDGQNVYDDLNKNAPTFLPHQTANLNPVLVEASLYYNLGTYEIKDGNSVKWRLRNCFYPRVTIWNPYNVTLSVPDLMAQVFLNGHKDVRLKLSDGGQSTREISYGDTVGHLRGMCFYKLPAIEMAPGQAVMFCPATTQRYDTKNLALNLLSPSHSPRPDRYFWQDISKTLTKAPVGFIEFPDFSGAGNKSGADNYMAALKEITQVNVTKSTFANMPMISYINQALQAGGSDEVPVAWANFSDSEVPVHQLENSSATIPDFATPDYRTRDGFRLRWWNEHQRNLEGVGATGTSLEPEHLKSAAIANWNVRAAYSSRNPFDNVSPEPPYMFGIYTHDIWDQAVSWPEMMPLSSGGLNIAHPFGPDLESPGPVVLFEVPRAETGIPSLAYFRHMKASEFIWHPGYAVGNSLADPRVELTNTNPNLQNLGGSSARAHSGWNVNQLGWVDGRDSNRGPDYWSRLLRQITYDVALDGKNHPVYDLSYEMNHSLWDDYYLVTGSPNERIRFVEDPLDNPLPNGRLHLIQNTEDARSDLSDPNRAFFYAASRLALDGGFNVHSTSVEAWKALLSSTRDIAFADTRDIPFPRLLNPPGGAYSGGGAGDSNIYTGFRSLSDREIGELAQEIVAEVKRRAPFFGLGDFVNRRLEDSEAGKRGPIEAATLNAKINQSLAGAYPIDNSVTLSDTPFAEMTDNTRLENQHKPNTTAWGVPGFLTQGDVLQVIGSSLRARSDSFLIRTYGESTDIHGNIKARAWCEATVQRVPDPVQPDDTGLNPRPVSGEEVDFGRKFRLISFRWLDQDEV